MVWVVLQCTLERTSSAMPVTPDTILMTASSFSWKISKLTDRPNGSLTFPKMLNVVSSKLSLFDQPSSSLTGHPSG